VLSVICTCLEHPLAQTCRSSTTRNRQGTSNSDINVANRIPYPSEIAMGIRNLA